MAAVGSVLSAIALLCATENSCHLGRAPSEATCEGRRRPYRSPPSARAPGFSCAPEFLTAGRCAWPAPWLVTRRFSAGPGATSAERRGRLAADLALTHDTLMAVAGIP